MPKIIGLQPVPRSEGISGELSLDQNRIVVKRFSLDYQIRGDSVDDDEDDILATPGLPTLGDVLRGATCKRQSVDEDDTHALLWNVRCDFDSRIEEGKTENPEDRPPKWSWTFETIDEVLEFDAIDGEAKPVQNSALEPLFITAPVAIPVLTVEKIQIAFDADTILNFANRTNSEEFWGAPSGCALMAGITDVEEIINGDEYRKVTYTIKFRFKYDDSGDVREDSWNSEPLDHGTRYFNGVAGLPNVDFNWTAFVDEQGNPTTGNLNGMGNQLFILDDPVYLSFNRFPKADFNSLALGPF